MKDMSHDAVNRFLDRENFSGYDLFQENKRFLDLESCVVNSDDSVIDKPYSNENCNDLVCYLYSGLHHRAVKGIGLITLFAIDNKRRRLPVNFRLYNPDDNKTKNDLFQEMIAELIEWGLKPVLVTGDSWYSSVSNIKFLQKNSISWLFGLKSNRLVSEKIHEHKAISEVDIPEEGKNIHLKEVGTVRVFRRDFKDQIPKYYATSLTNISGDEFDDLHSKHWVIETFHRAIKQVCNVGKHMVRSARSQVNHFFCVLRAFSFLEYQVMTNKIDNWYSVSRNLYNSAIQQFIRDNVGWLSTA